MVQFYKSFIITGNEKDLNLKIFLYVQIIKSHKIKKHEKNKIFKDFQKSKFFPPDKYRVGRFFFHTQYKDYILSRFVALNAFYWYILLLDNSLDENETTDIQDAFRDQYKFPKRIEANNNTTNILVSPIDCMQAEESQSALTMDQWLRYKNKNDME